MSPSAPLQRIAEELQEASTALLRQVAEKRWNVAQASARSCARSAGQLLQRLTVMAEILGDEDD